MNIITYTKSYITYLQSISTNFVINFKFYIDDNR